MPLQRPGFMPKVGKGVPIDWPWDDWNVEQSYQPGDADLMERLAPLCRRAQIAMTVAIAEWIVFRLESADPDPTPLEYLGAAWAGTFHHAYCPTYEFDDRDWGGPVRGPLHVAMALINDALHFEGADCAENAAWASQLARLVLPAGDTYGQWKNAVLSRLERWFPAPLVADDDFEYDWEAREPLVPRECFDPSFPFDPSLSTMLARQYVAGIDYAGNPFVSSPDDLRAAGVVPLDAMAS